MNYDTIINSIDSLEPLSDAILKIQKLFNNGQEELDINKLIFLIESDAILSINILKMANSPLYGFSSKIASVSQAVTLFGIMQIYAFIMSYAVSQNLKAKTELYGLSNERFNDICNLQSALLLQWYSKIDTQNARLLAPLALIMETGKLMIAFEVNESEYEKEFRKGIQESQSIKKYEENLLGVDSYHLSSLVFKHWHLDPLYIMILDKLDKTGSSSEVVQVARKVLNIIITSVNMRAILSKKSVAKACVLLKEMELSPDEFVQVAIRVKKAYVKELQERDSI